MHLPRSLVTCLLALSLLRGAAWAQPPAADGGKEAAAAELAQAFGDQGRTLKMLEQLRGPMITFTARTDDVTQEEAASIYDEDVMPALKAHIGDMIHDLTVIYANHFSTEEIHTLLAFYRTPLSQKLLAEQPQLAVEKFAVIRKWTDQLFRDSIQKHKRELLQKATTP